jgi:hypothetical protein
MPQRDMLRVAANFCYRRAHFKYQLDLGGGRSVGIVRLRTKGEGVCFCFFFLWYVGCPD